MPVPSWAATTAFNPEISANTLMLGVNSNRGNDAGSKDRNGISIQETEIQLASDVDPYWRFTGTFSIHQEVEVDTTTTPATRKAPWVIEPEELFADSLALPGVGLRVGKFKAAFGRHNLLHTHAYPFIDAPLQNTALLGAEGLNDVGASATFLLPLTWFSEFTLQGFSGQAEGLDYFHGKSANDAVELAHWTNIWDLSDEATFNVGLSAATGQNQAASSTNLYGLDLTYKWRHDKTNAFIWSLEAMSRERNQSTKEVGQGLVTWMQYQFAERWWAQLRSEYLEIKNQDPSLGSLLPAFQRKQSVLVAFVPSEFSSLRLQYDHRDDGAEKPEQKVSLQFNVTIGAHPAHAY